MAPGRHACGAWSLHVGGCMEALPSLWRRKSAINLEISMPARLVWYSTKQKSVCIQIKHFYKGQSREIFDHWTFHETLPLEATEYADFYRQIRFFCEFEEMNDALMAHIYMVIRYHHADFYKKNFLLSAAFYKHAVLVDLVYGSFLGLKVLT